MFSRGSAISCLSFGCCRLLCVRFCLVFGCPEAGFLAAEEAANVLVMFGDDEQGDGALNRDEEGRAVAVDEKPGEEGEAGRPQDGSE